jgi:hypothetical protein
MKRQPDVEGYAATLYSNFSAVIVALQAEGVTTTTQARAVVTELAVDANAPELIIIFNVKLPASKKSQK